MRVLIVPQRHSGAPGDNRAHFLLRAASVRTKVGFSDGSFASIDGVKATEPGSFAVNLTPDLVPANAAATQMEVTYTIPVTLGALTFTALTVSQRIRMVPAPASPLGYTLSPNGWFDAKGRLRTANLLVHPLVQASRLVEGRLEVNTLMLDITPGWRELHTNNPHYDLFIALRQPGDPQLRVLAHTAGTPLIWYALIPPHLVAARTVSPHIFLQPSDNREGQHPANEETYLLKNDAHFATDGEALMKYVLAPASDLQVRQLKSRIPAVVEWRNVGGVRRADTPTRKRLSPTQWLIPMGLSRAIVHRGNAQPAQFLLLPQRTGVQNDSHSGDYGAAVSGLALRTTRAILALIETNTSLTLHGGDTLLSLDKLIYSGYSEAGFDLWNVGNALAPHLKAIIAVEPQNLNKIQNDYRAKNADGERVGPAPSIGKDVIPRLLRSGVAVYIIGRHHAQYRPDVTGKLPEMLPADPAKAFAYPPDPAVNDFVKYRVYRFVDPSSDPLMQASEKAIMSDLESSGVTGTATLPKVFPAESNIDASNDPLIHQWYSHQFALSGGDELTPDPAGLYDKPVAYRTWFQVATQRIG